MAPQIPIRIRPFHSLLFLPASNLKILNSALKLPPQSIPSAFILDLEDSVALSQKSFAREQAVQILEQVKEGKWLKSDAEMWVRINAVGSGEEVEDLRAILPCDAISGIVVSKTESKEDLDFVESFVQSLCSNEVKRRLHFHPLIESPSSLLRLPLSHPRLASLSMAAEDFKASVSIQPSPENLALLHARQAIVTQARAMGVTPLDMVFVNVKDQAGLEKECVEGKEWGFGGKWLIHPTQVEITNRVFGGGSGEGIGKKTKYAEIDWS